VGIVNSKKIFSLRNSLGLTRETLAIKAGVAPFTITRAETKGTTTPSTLQKIADALGVEKEELLLGEPTAPTDIDPSAMAEFTAWCDEKGYRVDKYLPLALWLMKHLSPASLSEAMSAMTKNEDIVFDFNHSSESAEERRAYETVLEETEKAEEPLGKHQKEVG
jgi:transcriptional regulator with XRE-family HTH domain